MTSTLADLQRRNLEQMSAAEQPPVSIPSNETSIIPSLTPSNTQSNDDAQDVSSEVSHDGANDVSNKPSLKEAFASKETSDGPKARTKKSADTPQEKSFKHRDQDKYRDQDTSMKDALDAKLREHLMEMLMSSGGKGSVTRLNVEMPEDLHQRLKQHCVKTRTPIKGLINALIALYLDAEEA